MGKLGKWRAHLTVDQTLRLWRFNSVFAHQSFNFTEGGLLCPGGHFISHPMVVGYKGEIGSFILGGLLRLMPKASNIWCVDINDTEKEVIDRLRASNVIFLCVPIQHTIPWISSFKEFLQDKVILEQCSLKEELFEDSVTKGLNIRSMHILFRPSQTFNSEDRKLGLIRNQNSPETVEALKEVTQSEVAWFEDVAEHDREMAVQQALTHRTVLILADLLRSCKGSTFISKRIVELADRIRKGDIGLYQKIQENRHLPEHLNRLRDKFESFNLIDLW